MWTGAKYETDTRGLGVCCCLSVSDAALQRRLYLFPAGGAPTSRQRHSSLSSLQLSRYRYEQRCTRAIHCQVDLTRSNTRRQIDGPEMSHQCVCLPLLTVDCRSTEGKLLPLPAATESKHTTEVPAGEGGAWTPPAQLLCLLQGQTHPPDLSL